MTNASALLTIYHNLDTIYAGVVMIGVWVATTAHLLDWSTQHHLRILVYLFWGLAVTAYIASLIYIAMSFK